MVLVWEVLSKVILLIFLDISGYVFIYVFVWVVGFLVVCYIYYLIISMDMLNWVCDWIVFYNNDIWILCRLVYYDIFVYVFYLFYLVWVRIWG